MRYFTLIIFLVITSLSCQKEKTISEELVGEWLYERETFNSFSSFEDPDTEGIITLLEDETGNWNASNGFLLFSLEWDLQTNDSKIAITKHLSGFQSNFTFTTLYDLKREDEDNFTFTHHTKFEAQIDTLEVFEQFENIILTRIK